MKETAFVNNKTRSLRVKKLISKSLDNKQKSQINSKKKILFKQTIDELRNSFYGKTIDDPIEIESTKSENLDYVRIF